MRNIDKTQAFEPIILKKAIIKFRKIDLWFYCLLTRKKDGKEFHFTCKKFTFEKWQLILYLAYSRLVFFISRKNIKTDKWINLVWL